MIFLLKAARQLHGRMEFNGLQISIENRRGSLRQWYDPHEDRNGVTRMRYPYGYIRMTEGTDGDHHDVYVGPHRDAPNVYIVNQMKAPDFTIPDEQKTMLGFLSEDDARQAYLDHYDDSRFLGSITSMPFEEFKRKVLATKDGAQKLVKGGEDMCKRLGDSLGIDWKEIDLDEFCDGMFVEEEHADVTGGDPVKTAQIVLAHLREDPRYYTKLAKIEKSLPTVTAQIAGRMAEVKRMQRSTLRALATTGRETDRRHDAAVDRLQSRHDDAGTEEVRAGLAATGNFCRATIEHSTGAPPEDPVFHDARDDGGKFTPAGSIGHMIRRMKGE